MNLGEKIKELRLKNNMTQTSSLSDGDEANGHLVMIFKCIIKNFQMIY